MNASKVNSFVASMEPPSGVDEVSRYLEAAAKALGGRSDADLARTIGVSPATVASWKRRGGIPEDRRPWFTTALASKIAEHRLDLPQVGKTARAAFVELLVRTKGNPLDVARFRGAATAQMMGGLLALAEFFADLENIHPASLDSSKAEQIADKLEGAMSEFRLAAGPFYET